MKTTGRLKIAVAALILAFIFAACPLPEGTSIAYINWYLDNRDSSLFASTAEPASASIVFSVFFETSDFMASDIAPGLMASDIASVRIEYPQDNLYWEIKDPTEIAEHYNTVYYYFKVRLRSDYYTDNGSVLPIGRYNFTVTYSNGAVAKSSLLVPAPGSTKMGSTSYVYTEDYDEASNPPSNYAPLPLRASISSAVYDSSASNLTIKFTVDDEKIYNCSVWFYDKNLYYIGETDWYRNFGTGAVSSWVNGGSILYTDGTENTIVLPVSGIRFQEGKKMSDVDSLHIVLTDGHQYEAGPNATFDTRSISAKFYLN